MVKTIQCKKDVTLLTNDYSVMRVLTFMGFFFKRASKMVMVKHVANVKIK